MLDYQQISSRAGEIMRRWQRTEGSRWDPPLTKRQRQFLRDVCLGLSHGEIAELRCVSRGTVKSTVHAAYIRLGIIGDQQTAKALICRCIGESDGPITEPPRV